MKRLREKLKNRDGASLLLSLLVFLLCVMVAASVLAAAISNAGKAKSSRTEQQRYQTLSSAMRLICGELEKVEYTGKYRVSTWTADSMKYFYCQQLNGEFKMQTANESQTFKLADFTFLKDELRKEMNEVFRRQFQLADGSGTAKDGYGFLPDGEVITAGTAQSIHLTVTLPDNLTGYPDGSMAEEYELPKTVNVEIKLDHNSRDIKLTAWLDDSGGTAPPSGSGIMVAVLTTDADLAPVIQDPADPAPEIIQGGDIATIPTGTTPSEENKEVSVTWKLNRINMTTAP